MNKTFGKFLLVISCLLVAVSVFAVDDELVTRFLNAANDQYTAGNYPKAFSYINTVLNSYKEDTVPENVDVIAETIYYAYLTQIKDTRNIKSFNTVKEKLIEYPYLSSERITRTVKIINTYEAQDIAWGADPAQKAASSATAGENNNNPILYNTLELQIALEAVKKDSAAQNQKINDDFQKQLLETQKDAYESTNGANNRLMILSLLILAGVCIIVFVIVIINLILNLKSSKSQNEKFMQTLNAVSQMTRLPMPTTLALESLSPLYRNGGEMRMIGSISKETGLPPPPANEEEKKQLNELAQKCRDIGIQVDVATGRKNNSKNISELIYKIALEMGVTNYEATLFFSVGMVYDLGFLEIDRSMLQAENLTEAQKYEIRNHVKQGLAQLSFVPEKYMAVFADGVLMHHENMDGSGYPEGLSGSRIPFIARTIHVAESFIAMISRRNYRDIFDKETAVDELRNKPGLYDPQIVEVLDRII